jgi:ABC-2 type transport system ATP-binding protein
MSREPGTLEAHNLWKRFRGDQVGRTIREHAAYLGRRLRGEGRPWRWALRDVTVTAAPGDAIGLVGTNGSGKSTLLKIMTRVMDPYAGSVSVAGRVGALIEVRAGIHPELTGRENVYLYGTLLGLSRRDVARRFDDIVAFAELEDAIDRQVKFFSSGMQMRLGFAVAAFLEPDVLLVDEILAVGDAAFQQRCVDRMADVLAGGTTLVYVSHDLASVEAVCARGVWLANGTIMSAGPVSEVLSDYRGAIEQGAALISTDGPMSIGAFKATSGEGGPIRSGGSVELVLGVDSDVEREAFITVGFTEGTAAPIFLMRGAVRLEAGRTDVRVAMPYLPLGRGRFFVWAMIGGRGAGRLPWHPIGSVDVVGAKLDAVPSGVMRLAPVYVESEWDVVS